MGCAATHCRVSLLMAVSGLSGRWRQSFIACPHVMTAPLSTGGRSGAPTGASIVMPPKPIVCLPTWRTCKTRVRPFFPNDTILAA